MASPTSTTVTESEKADETAPQPGDNADTSAERADAESVKSQQDGVKEAKVEVLSHGEIMHVVKDTIAGLISTDQLLKDLHPDVTLEEVNSMIALEYGQAMLVNVQRADDEILPIVVKQEASVLDLKHGIKRYLTLQLSRKGEGQVPISWRYVWKHHWLYYEGEKLTDDNKLLKEYGIRNRDKVTFLKRLRER